MVPPDAASLPTCPGRASGWVRRNDPEQQKQYRAEDSSKWMREGQLIFPFLARIMP